MLCSRFERGLRNMREKIVQASRSNKEKEDVLQELQQNSPTAHEEDWGDAWCPPEAHREPQWSRYPPAGCGGTHSGPCQPWMELQLMETLHMNSVITAGKAPWGEAQIIAGFLKEVVGSLLEQSISEGLHTPSHGRSPQWSRSWSIAAYRKGCWNNLERIVSHWRDLTLWQGTSVKRKKQ